MRTSVFGTRRGNAPVPLSILDLAMAGRGVPASEVLAGACCCPSSRRWSWPRSSVCRPPSFQAPGAKTVYVVGDTIWRSEVDQALARFKPDVAVVNAGDARLVGYAGRIIMGKDDVLHAAQAAPGATVVASHMDAINHTTPSRKELREHVQQHGTQDRVRIPADGETLKFQAPAPGPAGAGPPVQGAAQKKCPLEAGTESIFLEEKVEETSA